MKGIYITFEVIAYYITPRTLPYLTTVLSDRIIAFFESVVLVYKAMVGSNQHIGAVHVGDLFDDIDQVTHLILHSFKHFLFGGLFIAGLIHPVMENINQIVSFDKLSPFRIGIHLHKILGIDCSCLIFFKFLQYLVSSCKTRSR